MSRPVVAIGFFVAIVGLATIPVAIVNGGVLSPGPADAPRADGTVGVDEHPLPALDQSTLLQSVPGEFDRTLFSIRVFENGSARWTFQYTRLLENDTEASDFEGYAEEFRTNETELYRGFLEQAGELARSGSNVTGRPMNATAFSRDARVTPLGNRGIVEMSFTWTNFGQQRDGGGVLVSDVFEGGIYIRSDQRLRFEAGPELAFEAAEPTPTNTSGPTLVDSEWIAWAGERSFADGRPAVTFQPATAVSTTTESGVGETTADGDGTTGGDGTRTDETTTAASEGSPGIGMLVTIAALALVALGVIVAAWVNGYLEPGDDGENAVDDAGETPGGGAASEPAGEPDAPLLTDEDRVTQLLADNGGRMKQTEIVDATEWSKSKVSMLLSEMAEEEQITKLRVGRENIISLPGDEPAAAGSPFDDEE